MAKLSDVKYDISRLTPYERKELYKWLIEAIKDDDGTKRPKPTAI